MVRILRAFMRFGEIWWGINFFNIYFIFSRTYLGIFFYLFKEKGAFLVPIALSFMCRHSCNHLSIMMHTINKNLQGKLHKPPIY